jgi:hypothetical protein
VVWSATEVRQEFDRRIAPIRRRPRKPVEIDVKKPTEEVRTEPLVEVPSSAGPVA